MSKIPHGAYIKPMSKIAYRACMKPDVAVTVQVEMHPLTAGWAVMNIKPMSKIPS